MEYVLFNAYVGNPLAVDLWDSHGRSEAALMETCELLAVEDPVTAEWFVAENRRTEEFLSAAPPPPPARVAEPATPSAGCDSNYTPCVPIASDVDCASGSGNGPAYVSGPVDVIGVDVYGLDRDGDGVGCE